MCPKCSSIDVIPIVYGNNSLIAVDLLMQKRIHLGSTLTDMDDRDLWHCKSCDKDFLPLSVAQRNSIEMLKAYKDVMEDLWANCKPLTDEERETILAQDTLRGLIGGFLVHNNCAELRFRLENRSVFFQIMRSGKLSEWYTCAEADSETLFPLLADLVESGLSAYAQSGQLITLPWRDGECPFVASVQYADGDPILLIRAQ
jgi:hypothetical protein